MRGKGKRESRLFMEVKDIGDLNPYGEVDGGQAEEDELFRRLFAEHETKEELKVLNIIKEIYASEKAYLVDLYRLNEARSNIQELQHKVGKTMEPMVSPSDLSKMFIDIQAIKNVHETILKEITEVIRKNASEDEIDLYKLSTDIGKLFSKLSPFLSMYTLYIQRFEAAIITLHRLREDIPSFDKATYAIESRLKLTLFNLINKPVQRLTKYPILMKALGDYTLKASMSSLEDSTNQVNILQAELKAANTKLKASVEKVNEKLKVASEMERLVKLHDGVGSQLMEKKLLVPWRRIIREDTISILQVGDREFRDIVVYILTDMIIAVNISIGLRKKGSAKNKRRSSAKSKLFLGSKGRTTSLTSTGSIRSRGSNMLSLFNTSRSQSVRASVKNVMLVISEMKLENLKAFDTVCENVEDEMLYSLSLTYEDIGDCFVRVKMCFEEESECKEVQQLLIELKKSDKDRRAEERKQRVARLKDHYPALNSFEQLI